MKMSAQAVIAADHDIKKGISLCPCKIQSVDHRLNPDAEPNLLATSAAPVIPPAPLGPLSNFVGTFRGRGFNTSKFLPRTPFRMDQRFRNGDINSGVRGAPYFIELLLAMVASELILITFLVVFRPNSGSPTGTIFPKAVSPPPPAVPNEAVLELNLTVERLCFQEDLHQVPNRGLFKQGDINLNGIPYQQFVDDVTNVDTGRADHEPAAIHFETGLWMHIPASQNPAVSAYVIHMHSFSGPFLNLSSHLAQ